MFNSISIRNHNDDTFASAENVLVFFFCCHFMSWLELSGGDGVASGGRLELLENLIREGENTT